jgi:hypothetical protein
MKKYLIIFTVLGLAVFLAAFLAIFYLRSLGAVPREPKSDVPITYQITRGSGGSDLEIKSFEVSVLEAPLNLFNSRALVQIVFEGTVKGQRGWKPSIDAVQMSERLKPSGADEILDIEAEPRMDHKADKQYQGGLVPFRIKIEYIVAAWKWGKNRIDFHTRGFEKTIVLHHPK